MKTAILFLALCGGAFGDEGTRRPADWSLGETARKAMLFESAMSAGLSLTVHALDSLDRSIARSAYCATTNSDFGTLSGRPTLESSPPTSPVAWGAGRGLGPSLYVQIAPDGRGQHFVRLEGDAVTLDGSPIVTEATFGRLLLQWNLRDSAVAVLCLVLGLLLGAFLAVSAGEAYRAWLARRWLARQPKGDVGGGPFREAGR